ncbi:MAG: hypothetical protein JW870_14535 [Candidatus Delongbacteria bacterium]|nr:hypothetical protein [Candidatus Delongbacteria bacterium]
MGIENLKQEKVDFKIENESTYTPEQIQKIIKLAKQKAAEDREGGSVIETIKIFDPVHDEDPEKGSAPGECQVWTRGGGSGPAFTINIGKELNIFPEGKDFWNEKQ